MHLNLLTLKKNCTLFFFFNFKPDLRHLVWCLVDSLHQVLLTSSSITSLSSLRSPCLRLTPTLQLAFSSSTRVRTLVVLKPDFDTLQLLRRQRAPLQIHIPRPTHSAYDSFHTIPTIFCHPSFLPVRSSTYCNLGSHRLRSSCRDPTNHMAALDPLSRSSSLKHFTIEPKCAT